MKRPNPKSRQHRERLVAQFEAELAEVCEQVFAERAPHSAADCATRMGEGLRQRWGSREIYIPASDTATRDRQIRRDFTGQEPYSDLPETRRQPDHRLQGDRRARLGQDLKV